MENTGERKTGGTGGKGDGREVETDVRESDSALISAILLGAVSIREKKDALFESFFEMLVLGAQSTDFDVQTHF